MIRWVLALVLFAAIYVAAAHFSGGVFPTPGLPVGGDRAEIRNMVYSFWEDIQFKDFKKAASYHRPEARDSVDIPYLLQRLFLQKPELLDIMDYEIVFAKVDSSKVRARVKSRVKVKELTREEIKEREVMLYFHRDTVDSPWYMELESSLRKLEADKDKKH